MRGGPIIVAEGHVQGLLGIYQRLVQSKINDVYAFELIEGLYEFLPLSAIVCPWHQPADGSRETMQPYSQTVFMLLLNRLQTKPSAQFTQSFVYFFTFLAAVGKADFLISVLEGIQPGCARSFRAGIRLIK